MITEDSFNRWENEIAAQEYFGNAHAFHSFMDDNHNIVRKLKRL